MEDKSKVKVIIVCIIILFAGALFISYPKIALSYHRWRLDSLLNQKPKPDPSTGLSSYGDNWGRPTLGSLQIREPEEQIQGLLKRIE